jgi:hypothetical protein
MTVDNLHAMSPDDEILLGHAADESRYSYERVRALARQAHESSPPPDLALAMAEFELHGATLRSLLRWYPDEAHVRKTLADWELFSVQLSSWHPKLVKG